MTELNGKSIIAGISSGVLIVGWLSYISLQNLPKPTKQDVEVSIQSALRASPYFEDRKLIDQTLKDLKGQVRELTLEVQKLRIAISTRSHPPSP